MKIIKKLFNNVDIVYNICYIIIKIKENFTSNCLYKISRGNFKMV